MLVASDYHFTAEQK